MEHFATPTTRAEAQAYIEHEFKKGGILSPEELYQPTTVSHPGLNSAGGVQSGFIDHLLHPSGEMGRTLHRTEKRHRELDMYGDADSGGEADE